MKMIIATMLWIVAEPTDFSILWILTGVLIMCQIVYEVMKEDF